MRNLREALEDLREITILRPQVPEDLGPTALGPLRRYPFFSGEGRPPVPRVASSGVVIQFRKRAEEIFIASKQVRHAGERLASEAVDHTVEDPEQTPIAIHEALGRDLLRRNEAGQRIQARRGVEACAEERALATSRRARRE